MVLANAAGARPRAIRFAHAAGRTNRSNRPKENAIRNRQSTRTGLAAHTGVAEQFSAQHGSGLNAVCGIRRPRLVGRHFAQAARRASIPLLTALLLGACAAAALRPGADDPARVTDKVNLAGFPQDYKNGYRAGCAQAGRARNPAKPPAQASTQFAYGWRDGWSYCRPREER